MADLIQGARRTRLKQLVRCVEDGLFYDPWIKRTRAARFDAVARGAEPTSSLCIDAVDLASILYGTVPPGIPHRRRGRQWTPHPTGVRLRNCIITGTFSLLDARNLYAASGLATWPLVAENCVFLETPDLSHARISSVRLIGCWIPGFLANGAKVDGDLVLDHASLHWRDANHSAALHGPVGDSIESRRLVDVAGATIAGDLHVRSLGCVPMCSDASKREASGLWFGTAAIEFDAENARVDGSVDIGYDSEIPETETETVAGTSDDAAWGMRPPIFGNFDNVSIGGDFLNRFTVMAPLTRVSDPASRLVRDRGRRVDIALDLRGADIRGKVSLEYLRSTAAIRLEDASIGQDLELGGAILVNPHGLSIEGSALQVAGSLHLVDRLFRVANDRRRHDPRLLSLGQIRLSRARIGADLDGSGAVVCSPSLATEGVAIHLRSAEISGSVYLDGRRRCGPAFFVGLVNMTHIRVAGSVMFSGGWFRAPAGALMGPQQIEKEIEVDDECNLQWIQHWAEEITEQCDDEIGDDASLLNEKFFEALRPRQMQRLRLDRIAARVLHPDVPQLLRLRGGYRAISLLDADIGGAVQFGTLLDTFEPVQEPHPNEPKPQAAGLTAFRTARATSCPSVVVGCVDLDRSRIAGDLRLSGGIFRAVTPHHITRSEQPQQTLPETGASPAIGPATGKNSASNSPPTGSPRPAASRQTLLNELGPEDSLAIPVGAGWAELKKRVCLSMRGTRIDGALHSAFFGAVPWLEPLDAQHKVLDEQVFKNFGGAQLPQCLIRALELIPVEINERFLMADRKGYTAQAYRSALMPHRWAESLITTLWLAAHGEAAQDRAIKAARPVDLNAEGFPQGYRLRPDGQFDLRGAQIRAVYDDPVYGWPTSDGHVAFDGFSYDFLALGSQHDITALRRDGYLRSELLKHLGSSYSDRLWVVTTWTFEKIKTVGGALGTWLLGVLLAIPYLVLLFVRFCVCRIAGCAPLRRPRPKKVLRIAIQSPGAERASSWSFERIDAFVERWRRWRRHQRYRVYAQNSFKKRSEPNVPIWKRRLLWLEQQYAGAGPKRTDFRPQPYEQMAKVMRATGYTYDADRIAAEKRHFRRRAALVNPVMWVADWLLGVLANYGYSPARILSIIAVTVALSSYLVATAQQNGLLLYDPLDSNVAPLQAASSFTVPMSLQSPEPPTARFQPLIYSIDTFVPVIDFGYSENWQSLDERDRRLEHAWTGFVDRLWQGRELDWQTRIDQTTSSGAEDVPVIWQLVDAVTGVLLAVAGCVVAILAALTSWAAAALNWLACTVGLVPEGTHRFDLLKDWIMDWPPAAAIAWSSAIFKLLGWLLTTIAVVTFTGVLRKD